MCVCVCVRAWPLIRCMRSGIHGEAMGLCRYRDLVFGRKHCMSDNVADRERKQRDDALRTLTDCQRLSIDLALWIAKCSQLLDINYELVDKWEQSGITGVKDLFKYSPAPSELPCQYSSLGKVKLVYVLPFDGGNQDAERISLLDAGRARVSQLMSQMCTSETSSTQTLSTGRCS